MQKRELGSFLALNPFPNGLTDGLFYREKMRAIHRIAPERLGNRHGRPARVLEIGGGRSDLTARLYPEACVTTVDCDCALLRESQIVHRGGAVCADARALPFPANCFDAATLFDVLEHIDEDTPTAIEALRVTRPGGWIMVSTPQADWHFPYYPLMRPWCPAEFALMREWGHVRRGYRVEALAGLFGAAPAATATFINPLTAFYHDVAFSRLGRRRRLLLYLLGAPLALAGYLLHREGTKGTEIALAWRKGPGRHNDSGHDAA